ncbi:MAG: hypothetical protein KGJ12_05840 [Gammaproteobacteria bacterium]|nr:hypothetical protein [Gammaproteobacteria bacterium]
MGLGAQRRPDIARAKRLIGFDPSVQLRQGLARTIENFRDRLGLRETVPPAR